MKKQKGNSIYNVDINYIFDIYSYLQISKI